MALGARRLERLEDIVAQITNNGGIALPFCLDVTQSESVEQAVHEIEKRLGPINVLINNAGVLFAEIGAVLETKIPMHRFGNLDDLDGTLLFLCSDASRYITGTIIRVDGGLGINKLQL